MSDEDGKVCPWCWFTQTSGKRVTQHVKHCLDNPVVQAATREALHVPGTTNHMHTSRQYEQCKSVRGAGVSALLGRYGSWSGVAEAFGLVIAYASTKPKHKQGVKPEESLADPQVVCIVVDQGKAAVMDWPLPLRTVRVQEYVAEGVKVRREYLEVGPWGGSGRRGDVRARAVSAAQQYQDWRGGRA